VKKLCQQTQRPIKKKLKNIWVHYVTAFEEVGGFKEEMAGSAKACYATEIMVTQPISYYT
jgi:hypothetical protein